MAASPPPPYSSSPSPSSVGARLLSAKAATEEAFHFAPTRPAPLPYQDPLPSYWTRTSQAPGPDHGVFSPKDGVALEDDVDVAIIGAGITGVSAAYHLALKLTPRYHGQQPKVVVLEARDFCSGATGRNGGHLTPLSVLSYDELASSPALLSRHLASSSREEHWGNDRGTKTDEVIRKILTLEARTAAEILMIVRVAAARDRKEKALERRQGVIDPQMEKPSLEAVDVELVSGSNWHLCQSSQEEEAFDQSIERAKQAGLSDLAMQVRKVPMKEWKAKLHEPERITAVYEIPGSTVHSRRLVILLQQLAYSNARHRGIDLRTFTQTPVLHVKSLPDGTSSLKTSRGTIKARYVIHATNAYASHLLPQFAGPKGIVPTRAQCISVLPTKSPSAHEPLWQMGFSLNHGFEYLQQRPKPDAETSIPPCILGGGRWAAVDREWGVADDTKVNPDVSAVLRPMLSDLFPNNFSKGDPVQLEWTGIIGHTKSGDPFVGPVLASMEEDSVITPSLTTNKTRVIDGQYITAGYSGHGMARAFSCAEVVVDMIAADRADVEWIPPVWFPLSYLTAFPRRRNVDSSDAATQAKGRGSCQQCISTSVVNPKEASGLSYRLLSAGSNSGGQLGIGSLDDSHVWARALYDSSRVSTAGGAGPLKKSFPPDEHRILQMAGGANHTLALIEALPSGYKTVWYAGDTSHGQIGDTCSADSRLFTPIDLPSTLENPQGASGEGTWSPKLVATSWENSYIVYADSSGGKDDVLFVFGMENDFGQSGLGKSFSTSTRERKIDLSEVLFRGQQEEEGMRGRVEILQLVGSVRHVVLLVTWISSLDDKGRRYSLLGWGAGRHGQLGPIEVSELQEGRMRGKGVASVSNGGGGGGGGTNVVWTPRIIQTWHTEDPSLMGKPVLSLGRDHTAFLIPSHWRSLNVGRDDPLISKEEESENKAESELLLLGSNKFGQLDPLGDTSTFKHGKIETIACTWNSTLLLLQDGSLIGSGRNDKGQLGATNMTFSNSSNRSTISAPTIHGNTEEEEHSQFSPSLVCGSEHALLLLYFSSSPTHESRTTTTSITPSSQVWGWGWNEHGNLGLGESGLDPNGKEGYEGVGVGGGGGGGEGEGETEDQRIPVRIWPPVYEDKSGDGLEEFTEPAEDEVEGDRSDAASPRRRRGTREMATDVWAGCATSFIQVASWSSTEDSP